LKELRLQLVFGGLALSMLVLTAQPSFASVTGTLLTGGNGTLTVSATSLTFTPNDTTGFSTEVASGTSLMFASCPSGTLGTAGCLTQGEGVDVNGGATITSLGPIPNFLTFATTPSLVYSLSTYQAGSADTNCAALTVGQSCSVFLGSPVVLTLEAGGSTSAELGVVGSVTDGSGASNWDGLFTATIVGETPAELQALILTGGSVTHSYSGNFFTASAVPEPRLMSLAALAGALLLIVVQKKRRKEA
jgi:hypothetical protein